MSASYPPPPPPPPYAPPKARPSIVTKWAIVTILSGIICIIVSAWGFYTYTTRPPPGWGESYPISTGVGYVISAIVLVIGALVLICGLGIMAAQSWALKLGGYTLLGWTKRPDVRAYFGLPPAYPAYPPAPEAGVQPSPPPAPAAPSTAPAPPVAPACPTCGQPLAYIQQYQKWYCQNCKKYV